MELAITLASFKIAFGMPAIEMVVLSIHATLIVAIAMARRKMNAGNATEGFNARSAYAKSDARQE
jgi:hypothetical protein